MNDESCTLSVAVDRLETMCMPLRKHIFNAHQQWNAHNQLRLDLDPETIITIEDYQMNMEVVYQENPTSLAYSSNKLSVAMYPICVEYKDSDGNIKKGAITFIIEDKDHSHQQVVQFEKRMFEIVREKLNQPIKNWIRFSDGCGAQFKSGYAVADLFNAKETFKLENAWFNFFESNEGKNTSDSIGSIVKCAFLRAILKSQGGVDDIDDILSLINSELKAATEKFSFFVVEKLERFQKRLPTSREYVKVDGIMSLHSLKVHENKVIKHDLTCSNCKSDSVCNECNKADTIDKSEIRYPEKIEYVKKVQEHSRCSKKFQDVKVIEENDEDCRDGEDNGSSDFEGSDISDDDEAAAFAPGEIVWAKHGTVWYPAEICSLSDVPYSLQTNFPKCKNKLIVKWFGEETFSVVGENNLDVLGENLVDAKRAARSKNITQQYNAALGRKLCYN